MPVRLRMAGLAQIAAIDLLDQRVGAVAARNTDEFVDLGLEPVVIFLRRGRADVEEIGEADDLPQQLEELRLPVFERVARSEEHTSELQSLMRISYAVFCLKK